MIAIGTVSERVGLPALLPDRRRNLKLGGGVVLGRRRRRVGLAALARLLLPLAEVLAQGGGLPLLAGRLLGGLIAAHLTTGYRTLARD
jgi:hypothetical protein